MTVDPALIARIAEGLPLGVWVARVDDGSLVWANPRFQQILGMDARDDVAAGEYAPAYRIETWDGEPYPEEELPFYRALKAGKRIEVDDIMIARGDGTRVYVRAEAQPVPGADGEPDLIAIAFADITREVEERRAREEADRRAARAARMEAIGALAGGIAHDFNNMLAAVHKLAELIVVEEDAARRQADAEAIRTVAERAFDLTRALLTYAGRAESPAETVRLAAVVAELGPILARTLDPRIEVEIDCAGELHVWAVRALLEQVVLNLVMNAGDALQDGGRLQVRTFDEGDRSVLEVCDDGVGMDAEMKERVFEPYFTTKTGGTHQGTGLGLATVLGIVGAYDGTVELLDREGGGTCARVELLGVVAARAEPAPTRPKRAPVRRGARVGTVLLVEDVATVRFALERSLGALGYDVVCASDGQEAVEVFRERHEEIDAVLLDLKMPRLDGRGALLAMREVDPEARVILVSAYATPAELEGLREAGIERVLPKSCSLDELDRALAAVQDA